MGPRENVKGYFRLNNECQVCPENGGLILIMICVAIVSMCIAGYWAQSHKINISILSIGVDYFQVLSIFSGLRVRWPFWVKEVLQILSLFNFNIDIAAPECIFTGFDYKTKWWITVLLPAIFGCLLLFMFIFIMLIKCIKQVCGCASKGVKYTSHGSKLLATFVLVFYFLYLAVVRRALDVFNCNPVEPDDGYLYTEFTSIDCEAGLCRCNDPDELQQKLVPWAIVFLIVYAIGFPLYVIWVTWYYRIQIKLDQLLRAYDLGEDRENSPDSGDVLFTPRKCCFGLCTRSKSKDFYDVRKRHHQLYYHFKPGKVYWLSVIIFRKFAMSLIALFFRANIIFMLATMLFVLFINYVLTAKHRPYMSTVERERVKESHKNKVEEAQDFIDADVILEQIPKDSLLHHQLDPAIRRLLSKRKEKGRRKSHFNLRSLSMAKMIHIQNRPVVQYYFDYNTVEIILIGSSIFLCLVAIMFESGKFFITDPETGIVSIDQSPTAQAFYNTVLVFAGFTLFGSLSYYAVVFLAEVLGKLPKCFVKCFADKKRKSLSDFGMDESIIFEDNEAFGGDLQKIKDTEEQTKKLKKGNMMEENNKGLAKKRSGSRNKKGRKKELRGGAFGQKRTQTGSTPKN